MGKATIVAAAALLSGGALWGQDVSRVYRFAHLQTPMAFREVSNLMRTVAQVSDATVDNAGRSLSTHGTADQMALTDWLFPELDQAGGPPAPSSHDYKTTGPAGVLHVFRLAHVSSPAEVQEIINVVRTIADLQRVGPVWESRTVVARGTADQVALAQWLIPQLDASGPSPGAPVAAYHFPVPMDPEVRVMHLAHTTTPEGIQELTNSVRTIGDMNRVFPCSRTATLVMRGTNEMASVAEWMLGQLDLPANQQGPAPHQQELTNRLGNVARVFYLTHTDTPQALQEVVNAVRISAHVKRIYPCNQTKAVILSGPTDQVTQAATLIAQLDR